MLVLQVGKLGGRLVRIAKRGMQKWSTRSTKLVKNYQRGVQNWSKRRSFLGKKRIIFLWEKYLEEKLAKKI